MTAIIILNWNGQEDTIACLESLFKTVSRDFVWMVVDNGSTDGSADEISRALDNWNQSYRRLKEGESLEGGIRPQQGIIYELSQNYGFAKANNMGVALIEASFTDKSSSGVPSHYLLLNNDTLVEPDFLVRLEEFSHANPQYVFMTPQIRYADPSEVIWNCGGKLVFGLRKYLYGNQSHTRIKEKTFIPIGLITGCALFAKREMLCDPDAWLRKKYRKKGVSIPTYPYRALLTERFFFGEEDFDLSLRMREEKKKMACVLDSVIYHKVGAARRDFSNIGFIYVGYLKRFIDVRQHWSGFKYFIWKWFYAPYISYFLYRNRVSAKEIIRFHKRLWKEAASMEGMNREEFQKWL